MEGAYDRDNCINNSVSILMYEVLYLGVLQPEVRFKFPVLTLFFPAAGGKHLYKVENDGISCNQGQQNPCFYTHPSTSILPRNSANSPRIQLDKSCSPSVKVRSAVHVLEDLKGYSCAFAMPSL